MPGHDLISTTRISLTLVAAAAGLLGALHLHPAAARAVAEPTATLTTAASTTAPPTTAPLPTAPLTAQPPVQAARIAAEQNDSPDTQAAQEPTHGRGRDDASPARVDPESGSQSLPTRTLAALRAADAENAKQYAADPDVFVRPGVFARRSARRVEVAAMATGAGPDDPVEFWFTPLGSGKDYEALAVTLARPSDVDAALRFIGMTPGRPINYATNHLWPRGPRVTMTATFPATRANSPATRATAPDATEPDAAAPDAAAPESGAPGAAAPDASGKLTKAVDDANDKPDARRPDGPNSGDPAPAGPTVDGPAPASTPAADTKTQIDDEADDDADVDAGNARGTASPATASPKQSITVPAERLMLQFPGGKPLATEGLMFVGSYRIPPAAAEPELPKDPASNETSEGGPNGGSNDGSNSTTRPARPGPPSPTKPSRVAPPATPASPPDAPSPVPTPPTKRVPVETPPVATPPVVPTRVAPPPADSGSNDESSAESPPARAPASSPAPAPATSPADRYAADVLDAQAITPNYNDATAVLDVPIQNPQGRSYGSRRANPAYALAPGTPITFTLTPTYADGQSHLRDVLITAVHPDNLPAAELRFTLNIVPTAPAAGDAAAMEDSSGSAPTPATGPSGSDLNLAGLLARLADTSDATHDVYVRVELDPAVQLTSARRLFAVLQTIESDAGIRLDPPADGELFHRAFFPDEQWRRSEDRLGEPWELHIRRTAAAGDAPAAPSLAVTLRRMTSEVPGSDASHLVEQLFVVTSAEQLATLLKDNPSQWSKALFVYPPPDLTYGQLMTLIRPSIKVLPRVFVFPPEGDPTTRPAPHPDAGK